jgi:hypothetical protein
LKKWPFLHYSGSLPPLLFFCLITGCAVLKTVISSKYPHDDSVHVATLEKGRLPIYCSYYTKAYLDSLPERSLYLIDSSLSTPIPAHGLVVISSEEENPSGKDVRTDIVSVYRLTGGDTVEVAGNARKIIRNVKEIWQVGETMGMGAYPGSGGWQMGTGGGDESGSGGWNSGPTISFTKTIIFSCYEKPSMPFFIDLKTIVPTSGDPDTLLYRWKVE